MQSNYDTQYPTHGTILTTQARQRFQLMQYLQQPMQI